MGVLYYLALVLGLFSMCWAIVGEGTARWLFGIIHIGSAMGILLLYMKELLPSRLTDTQNVGTSTSSQKLHS